MPGAKAVTVDVAYLYDGSLPGFFCCVYESVYGRELPASIEAEPLAQPTLFERKHIATDHAKAERVRNSVALKICPGALELVQTVFLSCLPRKELALLRFLLLGYREGPKALDMLGHPDVAPLVKAERHFWHERHLLTGFIRFADYNGMLAAAITPKNFVLPFLAEHFVGRFPGENFVIYDKTYKAALLYQDRVKQLLSVEEMPFPNASPEELRFQELWKRFYNTIAIEARYNPKCRMTHMPKRYWENMTEMKELL